MHKSQTAQDYIINTVKPEDWDIITLQESWIDFLGKSRASQYWRIIYPANYYEEGRSRIRSILLINTNINTDSYSVIPVRHSNIQLCASRAPTAVSQCSIFTMK